MALTNSPSARATRSSDRPRPDARGRAKGKATRQEQQKQDSRDRILDAAKRVLAERPYAVMAIEDVIKEAAVSRATFYRHFNSKFDICLELHKPYAAELYRIYEILAATEDPSVDEIASWLKTLRDFYKRESVFVLTFKQMQVIEPDFHHLGGQMRSEIFRRLGKHLGAFRAAQSKAAEMVSARTEAHLLLLQVDYFCVETTLYKWPADADCAAQLISKRLQDFIRHFRGA